MNPSTARACLGRDHLRRGAFTLVELLAALAIVGILAAIIIPAVSSMRSSAAQTKCLANLRGLGSGILLYAQDNKGCLPRSPTSTAQTPGTGSFYDNIAVFVQTINPYVGAESTLRYDWGKSRPNSNRVWQCPSDDPNDGVGYEGTWHGSSYDYTWQYGGQRITDPMTSGYEQWYPNWEWILKPVSVSSAPLMMDQLANHGRRKNVLFADMHVSLTQRDWAPPRKYK